MFTFEDSDGELADYLVLNDSKKRNRSVCQSFKEYKFYEQEDKTNTIKWRFKSNNMLTAVNETNHTVTATDGRIIHKNLTSNHLKTPAKRSEETRQPTNQCRRCGKFSQCEYCETHKRLMAEASGKLRRKQDEAGTSASYPKLPPREQEKHTVITITTDSQTIDGEEPTHREENVPETGETADTDEVTKILAPPPSATTSRTLTEQTPLPISPIGCSNAHSVRTNDRDPTATPMRPSYDTTGSPKGGKVFDSRGN